MKSMKIFKNFFLVPAAIVIISCSGNDDDSGTNGNADAINIQELITTATAGGWRITSYLEEGENETHHFTNFTFTFNQDGTVTAVNGENTINGTWSVSNDDDNDDDSPSSGSGVDFVLNFNVAEDSDFDDLNDDWDIENYSNNKISLIDVSGGDGGTDTLVFEKN